LDTKNAEYERTAVRPDQYPANKLPEIAFVGRSNVGKSTLINGLVNRKNLARVGATPGKTRQINFYNIDNSCYFVDLPGYGYAKVSKTEKESWSRMIETYLYDRSQLKWIIMLVDIRHEPSELDRQMYEWLKSRPISLMVVATKADKVPRSQLKNKLLTIQASLDMSPTMLPLAFSSMTHQGCAEIWSQISQGLK
jgi:GTP-binding protein